jgi:peptidyl-dipeptidase A
VLILFAFFAKWVGDQHIRPAFFQDTYKTPKMFYSSLAMKIRIRTILPTLPALAGLLLFVPTAPAQSAPAAKPTVADALAFIANAEKELGEIIVYANRAGWVQETYITDDTIALFAEANDRLIARETALIYEARKFDGLPLPPDAARKLLLLKLGIGLPAPSDPALRAETTRKAAELDAAYGRGKYCPDANPDHCMGIDDINLKMAASRDPKELAALWTGWHAVGKPMRGDYARLAELSNQGASELGFADTGALWRSQYDMTPEEFQAEIERLWTQVEPLYRELHTYVRRKLIEKYGDAALRPDGMIPGHLLGNMWAQEWGNIYDVVAPPSGPMPYDLGAILKARNTTPEQLVRYGEGFYKSLGFDPLPETFWKRSMLTHPRDRDVVCHPSAWDVDNQRDVRIKACFQPTADDFVTVHHELGHNYYQMAYRNQPYFLQGGANDGFHEAIFRCCCTPRLTRSPSCPSACSSTNGAGRFTPVRSRRSTTTAPGGPCAKSIRASPRRSRARRPTSTPAPSTTSPATSPICATSWPASTSSSSIAPCARPPATKARSTAARSTDRRRPARA